MANGYLVALKEGNIVNAVLKFRPVRQDDEPFLRQLRGQHDADRLFLNQMDTMEDGMKQNLLDLQYRAHDTHYQKVKHDWETKDNIIELDGTPIGRFIVSGNRNEIRLADILIENRYRGCGIGQAVLDATKSECLQSKRPLRLCVDKFSQAVQFYISQGFVFIGENNVQHLMEWKPESMPVNTIYFHQ